MIDPMSGKLKRKPTSVQEIKFRIGLTIISCFSL